MFEPGTLQQRAIVEGALEDLRNQRFNTDCTDNAGLIGREDQPIHFDAGSQRELGRRYAQKMLVIDSIATLPPPLSIGMNGGQAGLSWPATHTGWTLHAQSNTLSDGLGTNWGAVPGSTTTNEMVLPIGDTNDTVFFRLKSP